MTSEVIIDVQPKDISIALLEDKTLVEYQKEQRTASFTVGNIYAAKVKKLMPGLNACFVDVGAERVAFLHYLDLGAQFSSYQKYLKQVMSDRKKLYPMQKANILPKLPKEGSIANTLQVGDEIRLWPATVKLAGTPQFDMQGGITWDTSRISEGVLVVKDIETGIQSIENGELTIDKYYDLNGRQVRPTGKGVYIRGGKKIVITK
jgi:Ribonuclease G/E